MTDQIINALAIISVLLGAIFVVSLSICFSISKIENMSEKTHELLKQIGENTRDKTIPLKPQDVEFKKSDIKWGHCPTCRKLINSHNKHCGDCGTEIDWSDTE